MFYSCLFVATTALGEHRASNLESDFKAFDWILGDWKLINGSNSNMIYQHWTRKHELRYDGVLITNNENGEFKDKAKISSRDVSLNIIEAAVETIVYEQDLKTLVLTDIGRNSFELKEKKRDSSYVFKYSLIRDTLHLYKTLNEKLVLFKFVQYEP